MGLIKSFKNAATGLIRAFMSERNFRIHLIMMCYVVGFMGYYDLSRLETALILLLFGAVLSAELMNTSIEYIINMNVEGFDIRAKHAKDIAAGAVMVFAVIAVAVGLIFFLDFKVLTEIFFDLKNTPIKGIMFLMSLVVSLYICTKVRYLKK